MPEKETSTDRTEERAIITFSVDLGKTPMRTKEMIKETWNMKHENIKIFRDHLSKSGTDDFLMEGAIISSGQTRAGQ